MNHDYKQVLRWRESLNAWISTEDFISDYLVKLPVGTKVTLVDGTRYRIERKPSNEM